MFRNKYERKEVISNPGDPIKIVYEAEYDRHKNIVVKEKGKENLYAKINSFADSVDINVLISRFTHGDKEALLQRAGAYLDLSAMPTNINEFMDLSIQAENLFDKLPVQTKEKFGNNVQQFISTIGDPDWMEKMQGSADSLMREESNKSIKAAKTHKENVKKIENTVYGAQTEENPSVNPITGNEVGKE